MHPFGRRHKLGQVFVVFRRSHTVWGRPPYAKPVRVITGVIYKPLKIIIVITRNIYTKTTGCRIGYITVVYKHFNGKIFR